MLIAGNEIPIGKKTTVDIPIARLPTNTEIDLIAHVYRSSNPGPTLLVIGGVHGDEINGIEIVKRAEKQGMFRHLKHGNVIAIPLLNVLGFINYSREFPSGKDVNRSFPGTKNGSLASRVAYTLTKEILPHVDFGIDFHTGGKQIYNYPQARVYRDDPDSIQLGEDFGMPHLITGGLIKKSLRKTAHDMGIPMVVFEGGESQRIDEFSIQEGLRGLKRVLVERGMVKGANKKVKRILITDGAWIRASRSGMFTCQKVSGDYVTKGEVLGTISGPYGNFSVRVKSRKDGVLYGHNNQPVVNKGDALFHIGFE
jgi:predicted deacylase